ncbi:Rha family transcriptional regulator [Azospirillum sp. B4]|uniref:Rha family transcriptional regulator n=1 Tax=Azospirillum sp. B4 TaxID=95605 RepID=UPI000346C512|nr:Rha family transcriptional regulator [Azospirillum sp. B4]
MNMLSPEFEGKPIVTVKDGRAWTSSRDVADYFDKEHKNVLQAVDNLLRDAPELHGLNFQLNSYISSLREGVTRECRSYDMDRDGFALLAMGFTGAKALKFKLAYIRRFNAMEEALRARSAAGVDVPVSDLPPLLRAPSGVALTPLEINAWTAYLNMVRKTFGRDAAMALYESTDLPLVDRRAGTAGSVVVPELDGAAALRHLLGAPVANHGARLGELVLGAPDSPRLRHAVGVAGVWVAPEGFPDHVAVAMEHPRLTRAFALTSWAGDWSIALMALPGARPAPALVAFPDRRRRAVLLPWSVVRDAAATAMPAPDALQAAE